MSMQLTLFVQEGIEMQRAIKDSRNLFSIFIFDIFYFLLGSPYFSLSFLLHMGIGDEHTDLSGDDLRNGSDYCTGRMMVTQRFSRPRRACNNGFGVGGDTD